MKKALRSRHPERPRLHARWLLLLPVLSACQTAPSTPPDLVLVSLDNVRADHTSLLGYERRTTPSLRELASFSGTTTFTRAYSPASWSLPSYSSIFTGRHAVHHHAGLSRAALPEIATTLAEMLSAHGYRCAGFTGGAHLSRGIGLGQGYEHYQDTHRLTSIGRMVEPALAWLDEVEAEDPETPWFLFVQGYDAHIPYKASPFVAEMFDPHYEGRVHDHRGLLTTRGLLRIANGRYWLKHRVLEAPALAGEVPPSPPDYVVHTLDEPHIELSDRDIAHIIAHYDGAVRQADHHLGRLLYGLQERDLLDDTAMVVFADHGEALHEQGYFRHEGEAQEYVFHVPLVIRLPDRADPPRTWEGVVSLTDLLPTLAGYLDFTPPAALDGRTFLPALTGESLSPPNPHRTAASVSLAGFVVRDRDWQLLGRIQPQGPPHWSLRRDARGPDVSGQHPEVFDRLRAVVPDWPERISEDDHVPMVTDPELREALRLDGYWQREPAPPASHETGEDLP